MKDLRDMRPFELHDRAGDAVGLFSSTDTISSLFTGEMYSHDLTNLRLLARGSSRLRFWTSILSNYVIFVVFRTLWSSSLELDETSSTLLSMSL